MQILPLAGPLLGFDMMADNMDAMADNMTAMSNDGVSRPFHADRNGFVIAEGCGLPLLERGARGVRPTAAGEAIAQHARALFDLSARFAGDFRAFASGGQGSVRLGASASVIAGHDLGALLAGFAARRGAPTGPASTWWSCTPPTAIC